MPTMEIEMEPEPIRNENFITKWVGAFSNTVSVWIQNAGKCGRLIAAHLSLRSLFMIASILFLCMSTESIASLVIGDLFINLSTDSFNFPLFLHPF